MILEMAKVNVDNVMNRVAEIVNLNPEIICKMGNNINGFNINQLKLTQIKEIIRYLITLGCLWLTTTGNKPVLIESIRPIMKSIIDNFKSHRFFDAEQIMKSNYDAVASFQTPQNINLPSTNILHSTTVVKLASPVVAPLFNNNNCHNSSNVDINVQLHNCPYKLRAYRELVQQPGVTKAEILDELLQIGAITSEAEAQEKLDIDTILVNIVCKRQVR